MRLKSSLLSKNKVLLVEHFDKYLRFYYSDGHYEIVDRHIKNYIVRNDQYGYKKPILVSSTYLYPTINRSDMNCKWINLDAFIEKNHLFISLLKQKGLFEKAKKMYVKHFLEEDGY